VESNGCGMASMRSGNNLPKQKYDILLLRIDLSLEISEQSLLAVLVPGVRSAGE
jgi:hypothetical protein